MNRYVVPFSAASISAGVAVGSAWNSWATMPAMCGAAIDVPLIVLNVPTSSAPGPLRGSRPVAQIGRYSRQDEVMFSPGAERSGQVDGSVDVAARGVLADHAVPGAGVLVVVGGHREDAAGRVLAGRVGHRRRAVAAVVAGRPHGHDALGGQRPLQLDGGGVRVELAAADRAVGVVGDLDRRALGGGDARAARRLVVLQHPVQRRVGADDQQHGAGGDRHQARRRAPRPAAAPPSVSVVGRPATMPLTCVPWPPPEIVSVSTMFGTATTQSVLVVDSSRQRLFRLATTALLPSALRKYGCVGSTPESMTATETPLPSRAWPFAPVRVGDGLGAAGGGVGGLLR